MKTLLISVLMLLMAGDIYAETVAEKYKTDPFIKTLIDDKMALVKTIQTEGRLNECSPEPEYWIPRINEGYYFQLHGKHVAVEEFLKWINDVLLPSDWLKDTKLDDLIKSVHAAGDCKKQEVAQGEQDYDSEPSKKEE